MLSHYWDLAAGSNSPSLLRWIWVSIRLLCGTGDRTDPVHRSTSDSQSFLGFGKTITRSAKKQAGRETGLLTSRRTSR